MLLFKNQYELEAEAKAMIAKLLQEFLKWPSILLNFARDNGIDAIDEMCVIR